MTARPWRAASAPCVWSTRRLPSQMAQTVAPIGAALNFAESSVDFTPDFDSVANTSGGSSKSRVSPSRPPPLQLREGVTHRLDDDRHEAVDERLAHSQVLPAEKRRPAQDAAQHVAAALVARDRAVGEGEGQAANMVCDYPERNVVPELRVLCL